jgi:hypothetical protein
MVELTDYPLKKIFFVKKINQLKKYYVVCVLHCHAVEVRFFLKILQHKGDVHEKDRCGNYWGVGSRVNGSTNGEETSS